jgi:hypothetical protein
MRDKDNMLFLENGCHKKYLTKMTGSTQFNLLF